MFARAHSFTVCLVLLALTAAAIAAEPLGSGFTYQARLMDGANPANGLYDLKFDLYDAHTAGTLLGTQTLTNQPITDGLSNTILAGEGQFGANPFNGERRWLEISVNGTPLTPRQEITATPYAEWARRLALPFAGSAAATNAAFAVTNTGNEPYSLAISGVHSGSGCTGWLGHPIVGVFGIDGSTSNYGGLGYRDYGAYGIYNSNGNGGYLGGSNYGVYGAGDIYGVYGYSTNQFVPSCGVHGENTSSGYYGRLGTTGEGVYGWGGYGSTGVQGETTAGTGVDGSGYNGVWGTSYSEDGNGVRGVAHNGGNAYGVWGYSTSGWAGTFSGKAQVTGNFYAGAKFFRIDHPLQPEAKYLVHACVESDQMKNVYDGVATMDPAGEAWVTLPDWFEALNGDFRYQLTCIGEPALVYVKEKISGGRFLIAGGKPGMEVSWQVTGVRRDAYAQTHAMQVEVEKTGTEAGRYLHPEAFGFDSTRSVEFDKLQAAEAARSKGTSEGENCEVTPQ